jgi:hypothetical protein
VAPAYQTLIVEAKQRPSPTPVISEHDVLDSQQRDFYHTFGFLFQRQLFTVDEMTQLTTAFDQVMTQARDGAPVDGGGQSISELIEATPELDWILDSRRIYETVTDLLGADFIWGGSECNITTHAEHRWHADRFGPTETAYHRLKIMIYLDETRADRGCLRVLPGSHREPYHSTLGPLIKQDPEAVVRTYGIEGTDLPSHAVEAKPGDVLFFCHTLWHAVYHSFPGRRFMALKYAARPTTKAHIRSLDLYSNGVVFKPPLVLQQSSNPRLKRMVEGLTELAPNP